VIQKHKSITNVKFFNFGSLDHDSIGSYSDPTVKRVLEAPGFFATPPRYRLTAAGATPPVGFAVTVLTPPTKSDTFSMPSENFVGKTEIPADCDHNI
jgi:hypothetical protein